MKSLPRDSLKWVAAAFALVATATAEYEIARAIGMNEWIAAAVPGALDAYVVRALRSGREVLTSVVAMVGVNAASHLVTAGILPVEWPLITAVSAIAPLVLWRVHALGTPGEARRRLIWGVPWRARPVTDDAGVLVGFETSEHTEHDRAPDNPEPPGTREHPEHGMPYLCPHGCAVWGDIETHVRSHKHMDPVRENAMGLDVPEVEHAASTDDLDVPDWVNPPSTPPVPVHAPYADHVHVEHTDPGPVLLPEIGNPVVRARHLSIVHTDEHTASTARTADDWNREHVSTGVLDPEDTEHMERARELFHTGGGVPTYRALKEGQPGMGTPRASRIRAALKIEAEGTD